MNTQTIRIVARVAVLLAVVGSGLVAQNLVKSEPANGATNVPVTCGVIRLHFDCDMRTDSYTVWRSQSATFPPLAGDNSKPWKSARIFELSIGKLEPGATYALQLYSPSRQGFQAADGRPTPIATDQTLGGGDVSSDTTNRRKAWYDRAMKATSAVEKVEYYTKAARAGHVGAMVNLGCMHMRGEGTPVNQAEGLRLFRMAAEAGNKKAKAKLNRLEGRV